MEAKWNEKNEFSGEIYLTEETLGDVVRLLEEATHVHYCCFQDENSNPLFLERIRGGLCVQNDWTEKPRWIKKGGLENFIKFQISEGKRILTLKLSK